MASARQGLPRRRRLPNPKAFANVLRRHCRSSDELLTVFAAPSPAGEARLGLTVSRRVSRKAVERNRIKRRIRESFRRVGPALPAVDIVVIARPPAATAMLDDSLQRHWRRIVEKCKG